MEYIIGLILIGLAGLSLTKVIGLISKARLNKVSKTMISYVDVIKVKLYAILTNETLDRYEDETVGKYLIATAINELFGCHNEESLETYNNNKELITQIITDLFLEHPEIKGVVTDALRVFWIADCQVSNKAVPDMESPKKALNMGIIVTDRKFPDFDEFQKTATTFAT